MKWSGCRWLTTTAARSCGPDVGERSAGRNPVRGRAAGACRPERDEVAGARGALAVGVGGPGAQHRQPHRVRHRRERSAARTPWRVAGDATTAASRTAGSERRLPAVVVRLARVRRLARWRRPAGLRGRVGGCRGPGLAGLRVAAGFGVLAGFAVAAGSASWPAWPWAPRGSPRWACPCRRPPAPGPLPLPPPPLPPPCPAPASRAPAMTRSLFAIALDPGRWRRLRGRWPRPPAGSTGGSGRPRGPGRPARPPSPRVVDRDVVGVERRGDGAWSSLRPEASTASASRVLGPLRAAASTRAPSIGRQRQRLERDARLVERATGARGGEGATCRPSARRGPRRSSTRRRGACSSRRREPAPGGPATAMRRHGARGIDPAAPGLLHDGRAGAPRLGLARDPA